MRREPTSLGTFLCSLLRDGLRCAVACDGVMMDAGSIRRNYVYPPDYAQFTYGDLKKVVFLARASSRALWRAPCGRAISIRGCSRFGKHEPRRARAQEIPFDTEMVVVSLPGQVVMDAVRASRERALLDPPQDWGGYMQLDDGFRCIPPPHSPHHLEPVN